MPEPRIDSEATADAAGTATRALRLWEAYTREEVHDIFEPDTPFTPQTGKWGLPGIVRLSETDGDFVFFVTFGSSQGDHQFDEEITRDGVLTWQSQPRQRLDNPTIRQFIRHSDLTNSIHLFLRTKKGLPYTYFGTLGYLSHDPTREAPVHFTWQLLDWPAPGNVLGDLNITLTPSADPSPSPPRSRGELTKTPPPAVSASPGRAGGGSGRQAVLPGQDARNRRLGLAGEHLVLKSERETLRRAGRPDLAEAICHVAVVEGDSAGYDIRSFNLDGTPRYLEVKTTGGPSTNAFFISPNEVEFSRQHPDAYVLVRVFDYSYDTDSANCYEVAGPIEDAFNLTPSEYRARLAPGLTDPATR